MTTINTIEDLPRILRDKPTWAEAPRAILPTQELLDLPGPLDGFVQTRQEFNQAHREFNQAQQETNRLTDKQLNDIKVGLASRIAGMNRSPSKPLGTEFCRVAAPC